MGKSRAEVARVGPPGELTSQQGQGCADREGEEDRVGVAAVDAHSPAEPPTEQQVDIGQRAKNGAPEHRQPARPEIRGTGSVFEEDPWEQGEEEVATAQGDEGSADQAVRDGHWHWYHLPLTADREGPQFG